MLLSIFHTLIAIHIVSGSIGAITFWIPVLGRKGGVNHRRWGRIFTIAVLITGSLAMTMSLFTLYAPLETHPHLVGLFDASFVRGIFGWMMLTTGLLTVNLAWYGWLTIQNKSRHELNRTPLNLGLQYALIPVSVNCAVQGWLIGQPLMYGMSAVGLATAGTNLWFLSKKKPGPAAWTKEHLKALVGAGISVYTAFLAFGSLRILPQLALHPAMWAIPLVTGVSIILWHWRMVDRQFASRLRYSNA
jgi:hypothetical protein